MGLARSTGDRRALLLVLTTRGQFALEMDHTLDGLRQQLTSDGLTALMGEGRAMSLEQPLRFALEPLEEGMASP